MAPPRNSRKRGKEKKKDEEIPMKPATIDPRLAKKSTGGCDKGEKKGQYTISTNPKHSPSQIQRPATAATQANPLLDAHKAFMASQCTPQERDNFFSNTLMDSERRAELWMDQAERGEELVNQYSWAIPDERAMRILKHFSPLVEIGCGANAYWARLMAQAGIDIMAYDMFPEAGGQINVEDSNSKQKNKKRKRNSRGEPFQAHKGGPEVLASKTIRDSKRTLFLCYSDEEATQPPVDPGYDDGDEEDEDSQQEMTSLGTECLKHFTGDYIVHVGELYGETPSIEQAPWGRSSGAAFQQELAATFHCLLRVSLPNWIHVKDTISVWKRSETCSIVFAADSDDEEDDDEEVEYRHIPVSERLPADVVAPCLSHLLNPSTNSNSKPSPKLKPDAKEAQPKQKEDKVQTPATASSSSSDNDDGNSDSDMESSEDELAAKKQIKGKDHEEDSSSDDDEGEDYVVQW